MAEAERNSVGIQLVLPEVHGVLASAAVATLYYSVV